MRLPKQGESVLFIPRVPYGRQGELTALITKIYDAETGDIDLVFIASGQTEWQSVNHAVRMSDTVKLHCWKYVESIAADGTLESSGAGAIAKVVRRLEDKIETQQVQIDALTAMLN